MAAKSNTNYVILDCDGGSDDAWALALLLKAHEEAHITLLGVTITGNGNTTGHNAACNTLRILKVCNHLEIPVYLGVAKSMLHSNNGCGKKPAFHGRDGFGDILPEDPDVNIELIQKQFAVEAIGEMCKKKPKQVTIIAIGPLTNIALCYLMYDTVFAESVKDIFIMGGNYQGVGNFTRAAEFNFYSDPEAAHIVLSRSTCPLTILPWEPCMEDRFPLSIKWRLEEFGPKAMHHPVVDLLNKVEASQYLCSHSTTWNPCDALLVAAYLFGQQFIIKHSHWHCLVNLTGETRGQMVLDHLHEVDENPINMRLIEAVRSDFFKLVCEWYVGLQNLTLTINQ